VATFIPGYINRQIITLCVSLSNSERYHKVSGTMQIPCPPSDVC
jgi:hypothetical protein